MVSSLALCPDDAKQDSEVNRGEFGVVFLRRVHVLHLYRRASIASASTIIRVLRESATFGWS